MSKLIGNKPNQVPTNGDLGTMAYLDYDAVVPAQSGNAGKFLTTDGTNASWSDTFTGAVTFDGGANFGDNDKAIFGAGSDLQIYHDGANNHVVTTGGDLNLKVAGGGTINLGDQFGNTLLKVVDNADVKLYYGMTPSQKLATTSTGIDVTGTVTADGLTLANATYIKLNDSASAAPRVLGINASNVTYIGPIDSYAGGGINYGISANVSTHQFYTGGTERMRIDSAGNVGIGTSSPDTMLQATNTAATTDYISYEIGSATVGATNKGGFGIYELGALKSSFTYVRDGSANTQLWTSGNLSFAAGSSERMRIDSNGNVGIGTSSPAHKLEVSGDVKFGPNGTTNEYQGLALQNGKDSSAATSTSFVDFRNNLGVPDAHLFARRETDGSSSLAFGTTPAGSRSADRRIERMRIDSSGNLLVGGTSITSNDTFYVAQTGVFISRRSSSGGITHSQFYNGGTQVGSITSSTTATAYNTSSDYRLKTDVQPMANSIDRVKQLKPVNFEWISSGERVDGFLAHEAQEVVPEAVTGTKDAMQTEEYEVTPAEYDDEGNVVVEAVMGEREVPDYQGIDQSKLVPLLTAALQEALTEIDNLKQRVSALEAK